MWTHVFGGSIFFTGAILPMLICRRSHCSIRARTSLNLKKASAEASGVLALRHWGSQFIPEKFAGHAKIAASRHVRFGGLHPCLLVNYAVDMQSWIFVGPEVVCVCEVLGKFAKKN